MTTSEGGDDFAEHLGVKLPCVNELGFLVACLLHSICHVKSEGCN